MSRRNRRNNEPAAPEPEEESFRDPQESDDEPEEEDDEAMPELEQAQPPSINIEQPALMNFRNFIISPWQGTLELNTKYGKGLWDEGTKPAQTKFTGYGKDVVPFLAEVQNRVNKCYWHNIVTINGRNLLKEYGSISLREVKNARDMRNLVSPNSWAQARPQIDAKMMYHFIYDSLGPHPQKLIGTRIEEVKEDGPTLLKMVLDNTFIASKASTFTIREKFYDLDLKRYKWNVVFLNQDVREKIADLHAAGAQANETDMIITLFRAYNTASNEEFKNSLAYWKNEWNSNIITTAEELMDRAAAKYEELRMMGTWGKRVKDDQIVALTAKIEELKKDSKAEKGKTSSQSNWKYDRSLTKDKSYTRGKKTYKWCTGPGHNEKAMWVLHEPGKCTAGGSMYADERKQKKNSFDKKESTTGFDKKAFTAKMKANNATDDEIQSKIEAIMAVMES